MGRISVIDEPVKSVLNNDGEVKRRDSLSERENPDKLGTGRYAQTLAEFIRDCDTPITIGVQGEWGSGKTSILNMIREDIEEQEIKKEKGDQYFKCIWVNTWEHSLLKTPELCLLSIIEEIIDEIALVDNSYNTTEKAKSALSLLAKGAIRVGASIALGSEGRNLATEMMESRSSSNTVKQLRSSLEEIVTTVVNRNQNKAKKFVIFIDDLDRIEPSTAVMVLELLKNIFTINHCVFVLAIDYQVVVKGLKAKFGEPTAENEWEFRAFFDKIIQLPFMMPMAQYDLKNYINAMLIDEIGFFEKREKNSIQDGRLAAIVELTLGRNPRAMKRLLNSLSILNLHNKIHNSQKDLNSSNSENISKQLIFALVCCQISFPRIYETLLREPDFTSWDDEFVNKVTGGPHKENRDVQDALERAKQAHQEDFDEDWEESLFKIVWLKKWQRSRLPEISRFLTEIKEGILQSVADESAEYLKNALETTAITAVSSTEEGFSAHIKSDDANQTTTNRINYWRRFKKVMDGSQTVFDTQTTSISDTYSSFGLGRKHDKIMYDEIQFIATTTTSSPLKLESYSGDPKESFDFFEYLKNHKSEIEEITGGRVNFRIGLDKVRQSIVFETPPAMTKKRVRLEEKKNEKLAESVHEWTKNTMQKLEPRLEELLHQYENKTPGKSVDDIIKD